MNNNWDQLIRAIVPLTFLAIWAITSLFNRESKPVLPNRTAGTNPPYGPRAGAPSMRWSPPPSPQATQAARVRRASMGDDDIVILPSDGSRTARPTPTQSRAQANLANRRAAKVKPVPQPAPRTDSLINRTKLAGVSQNVNQHLTHASIEMTPLSMMPPSATSTTMGLASAPSVAAVAYQAPAVSLLSAALADPARLREAIIISEILQPPVSLRRNRPLRG